MRKLFNIHSRLHYEVSYLNRLYTRLIPNFRLLRFNSPCKCFKGSTRWWIKQHSSHAIPKQNNKWWNEIHTFFREEKNVSIYHYEIAFTMKAKENETFWLIGRKLLPLFRKAWRWNFYRKFRNMSSKIIINFSSINNSKNNKLMIDFFGDAAKKHKQIYKTFNKQRYKLGWFINRSNYNINHCIFIIYRFWITTIVVMAAGACCGLVVPNEILTQYLKRKGHSVLEEISLIQETQCSLNTFIPKAKTTK